MPKPKVRRARPAKRKPNARALLPERIPDVEDESAGLEYDSDDPLAGIPELARSQPTRLMIVHAAFTAHHVIGELRFQFEMGNLTRSDLEELAQLGKEIAAELANQQ